MSRIPAPSDPTHPVSYVPPAPRALCVVPSSDCVVVEPHIEDVVNRLCDLKRSSTIRFAVEVGRIVVEGVFGGSVERARGRGEKDTSFRRLAEHPNLPFSAATLWRAVAIYDLVQRMPGLLEARHLSVGHLRAVVGLSPWGQERLLRAAEVEHWPAERVERFARRERIHRQASGRQPAPPVLRVARHFERALRDHDAGGLGTEVLREHERDQVRETLLDARAWCERALTALDERTTVDAAG